MYFIWFRHRIVKFARIACIRVFQISSTSSTFMQLTTIQYFYNLRCLRHAYHLMHWNLYSVSSTSSTSNKTKKFKFILHIFYLKVKSPPPVSHPPCTFFNQVLHMWYTVFSPGFMPTPHIYKYLQQFSNKQHPPPPEKRSQIKNGP